jgi:hypothetical protein
MSAAKWWCIKNIGELLAKVVVAVVIFRRPR